VSSEHEPCVISSTTAAMEDDNSDAISSYSESEAVKEQLKPLRDSIVDRPPFTSGSLQLSPSDFSLFYKINKLKDDHTARLVVSDILALSTRSLLIFITTDMSIFWMPLLKR
jgi:hypothetical protein